MLWTLISIETKKMFRRPRTYLGFAGAALIPLTVMIIFYFKDPTPFIAKLLGNMFTLSGSILNGYLVSLLTINQGTMNFFLPVLIVLVVGEIIAGEEHEGTMRLILSRPINRGYFISSKFISAVLYNFILVLIMLAVGLGGGLNYKLSLDPDAPEPFSVFWTPFREHILRIHRITPNYKIN